MRSCTHIIRMQVIVTAVTFCVFLFEALIHYNIGARRSQGKRWWVPIFPALHEVMQIASVVMLFSILNGFILHQLHKVMVKCGR